MAHFREILKNKNFLFIWLSQVISQWGDRLGQIALVAYVYERNPGSPLEMAKILSFTIIPVFLIGPIAGVYVDRWDRRKTMFISDLLRTILVVSIPLYLMHIKSTIPLYVVIFLVFCIGRFFVPAKMAIIPDLVSEKELLLANSLANVTGMIAAVLGFGLGGVIVEWWKAQSGFYIDALSFFISALLIYLVKPKDTVIFKPGNLALEGTKFVKEISSSIGAEIKEGILYLFKLKEMRFTTGMLFLLWSVLGSVYAVFIVFIQQALRSATKDLGLLIMFLGVGLFLGTLIYGRFFSKAHYRKAIFACLFLSGAILLVFVLLVERFPNFILASAIVLFLGLVVSPIMNISNTLVHKASENEMRGKVFSSLEIVMHFAFLVFMFASSIVAELGYKASGVIMFVGAFLCIFSLFNLAYNKVNSL